MISALKPLIAAAAWAVFSMLYALCVLTEVLSLGRKSPSARDFLEDDRE